MTPVDLITSSYHEKGVRFHAQDAIALKILEL